MLKVLTFMKQVANGLQMGETLVLRMRDRLKIMLVKVCSQMFVS